MTLIKINPSITRYYKLFVKFHTTRDYYDLPDSVELNNYLYRIQRARELKRFITVHDRFILFAKDVEIILGKADYDSQNVLLNIRKGSGLPEGAPVVINDFCENTGIDFETVYQFMNINRVKGIEASCRMPRAWEKYFKTRDWYDLPDSIDANNLLHTPKKEGLQKAEPDVRPRIIIYPKDIELYYNHSSENALGFLHDVRRSQGLSISTPVMIGDVNTHNEKQDNNFLSFIINS